MKDKHPPTPYEQSAATIGFGIEVIEKLLAKGNSKDARHYLAATRRIVTRTDEIARLDNIAHLPPHRALICDAQAKLWNLEKQLTPRGKPF